MRSEKDALLVREIMLDDLNKIFATENFLPALAKVAAAGNTFGDSTNGAKAAIGLVSPSANIIVQSNNLVLMIDISQIIEGAMSYGVGQEQYLKEIEVYSVNFYSVECVDKKKC